MRVILMDCHCSRKNLNVERPRESMLNRLQGLQDDYLETDSALCKDLFRDFTVHIRESEVSSRVPVG
jgi:hypothetical protein